MTMSTSRSRPRGPGTTGAIPASSVAAAIAFAMDQPAGVDVSEIIVRPTAGRT
ncbi:hypothetical protein ACFVW1_18380 [Streptomyces olivochromogenes]|uniref:hypothetical protein n=1 Tax=Streptomyces olivochromogenes TaxID=1963 RepID=UPI0036DCD682